jgi:hypothetical protein
MVVVQSQTDLPKIILTLRLPCHLAGRLHGRQQQGRQNTDDRYDNQQFNDSNPKSNRTQGS